MKRLGWDIDTMGAPLREDWPAVTRRRLIFCQIVARRGASIALGLGWSSSDLNSTMVASLVVYSNKNTSGCGTFEFSLNKPRRLCVDSCWHHIRHRKREHNIVFQHSQ